MQTALMLRKNVVPFIQLNSAEIMRVTWVFHSNIPGTRDPRGLFTIIK